MVVRFDVTFVIKRAGTAKVCATLEEAGSYDCHASLMDLPGLFETSLETIPKTVPYISVDKELIETWSEQLGRKKNFRVRSGWSGLATPNTRMIIIVLSTSTCSNR